MQEWCIGTPGAGQHGVSRCRWLLVCGLAGLIVAQGAFAQALEEQDPGATPAPSPEALASPGGEPTDGLAPAPPTAPSEEQPSAAEHWMEDQVVAAERSLAEARFASAKGIAAQLSRHPAATDALRLRLEYVHAVASFAIGDEEAARTSFQRVQAIDPGFSPGAAASPKIRRAFELARRAEEPTP